MPEFPKVKGLPPAEVVKVLEDVEAAVVVVEAPKVNEKAGAGAVAAADVEASVPLTLSGSAGVVPSVAFPKENDAGVEAAVAVVALTNDSVFLVSVEATAVTVAPDWKDDVDDETWTLGLPKVKGKPPLEGAEVVGTSSSFFSFSVEGAFSSSLVGDTKLKDSFFALSTLSDDASDVFVASSLFSSPAIPNLKALGELVSGFNTSFSLEARVSVYVGKDDFGAALDSVSFSFSTLLLPPFSSFSVVSAVLVIKTGTNGDFASSSSFDTRVFANS